MMTYLIVFLFLISAFIFMAAMLYFSKYKQREGGCCASSLETNGYSEESCISCPNKEESAVQKQIEKFDKLGLNS